MKLSALKSKIDEILLKHPEAADADVLIDTEARCFPAHMIDMEQVYYDLECNRAIEHNMVYMTMDLTGATHWREEPNPKPPLSVLGDIPDNYSEKFNEFRARYKLHDLVPAVEVIQCMDWMEKLVKGINFLLDTPGGKKLYSALNKIEELTEELQKLKKQ